MGTIALFLGVCMLSNAQTIADPDYYLVDSLQPEQLSPSDVQLLDSCLRLFHQAKDDTSKVKALNAICEKMVHDDWVKYQKVQVRMSEKMLKNARSEKEVYVLKSTIGKGYNNLGFFAQDYEFNDSLAIHFYNKALKIQQEVQDIESMSMSYNNLGYLYELKGQIPQALEYHYESLRLREQISDKTGIAQSQNNIAWIQQNLGDIDQAISLYRQSLKIRRELGDKNSIAESLNNLGYAYELLNQNDSALHYFEKSLEMHETTGNQKSIANAYNNIGFVHEKEGRDKLAYDYFQRSLDMQEKLGDLHGMTNTMGNLGRVYLENGNLIKARHFLEQGMEIARKIDHLEMIRHHASYLSLLAKKEGNYREAFEMRNIEIMMRDSLANEKAIKAAARLQAKYLYEKEKEITDVKHQKELEKQNALAKEEKEKQQIVIYSIGGGLLLILVFSVVIYQRLQVTRKQKEIIEEQKEEVEAQRDQIEEQKNVVEEAHNEIKDSINYAKRIQEAILPSSTQMKQTLRDHFILYLPKDVVAGDFYWVETYEGKVYVAAADCTGHGVPGALVSVVCSNALTKAVLEESITGVDKILDRTREIVIEKLAKSGDVKDGMDISLACIDVDNTTLEWAGANNPLYVLRESEIRMIKGDREPIGFTENPSSFAKHKLELTKGDIFYLFTDGYADQFGGAEGKKMGYKKFREKLLEISPLPMHQQKEALEAYFHEWSGFEEQLDDICILGVRIP